MSGRGFLGVTAAALAAALACSDSAGGPDAMPLPPDACAGSAGCNGAGGQGDAGGRGRYCTRGGGQCADTPDRRAPFCTADFSETELWFCTRPCDDNTQCGEDALCVQENGSGPSGCFPTI